MSGRARHDEMPVTPSSRTRNFSVAAGVEFEHQRLVVGGVGFGVDFHRAQRGGAAAGGEEEVAAMRAFGPLFVVVDAADGKVQRTWRG